MVAELRKSNLGTMSNKSNQRLQNEFSLKSYARTTLFYIQWGKNQGIMKSRLAKVFNTLLTNLTQKDNLMDSKGSSKTQQNLLS